MSFVVEMIAMPSCALGITLNTSSPVLYEPLNDGTVLRSVPGLGQLGAFCLDRTNSVSALAHCHQHH